MLYKLKILELNPTAENDQTKVQKLVYYVSVSTSFRSSNYFWQLNGIKVPRVRSPEPKAASTFLQTLSFPFEFLKTLDPLDLRGMLSDVRVQFEERVVLTVLEHEYLEGSF